MSSAQSSKNNKALRISGVLAMVAVGHLVSAWLIGNMKMPEIRPLELTKPLEVKMIHIEKPKPIVPPPPKPKPQPPKPKEQPKPKPQPPKKVVEKPKQEPKKTEVPKTRVVQTKNTSTKKQTMVEDHTPVVTTHIEIKREVQNDVKETKETKSQPQSETKTKETESQPQSEKTTEPKRQEPVSVSEGQLAWQRRPHIDPSALNTHLKQLEADSVTVTVSFTSDAKGKIVSATVTKSSGIPALDTYVKNRVMGAKLKEYKPNGVPTPVKSTQNFLLRKPK